LINPRGTVVQTAVCTQVPIPVQEEEEEEAPQ